MTPTEIDNNSEASRSGCTDQIQQTWRAHLLAACVLAVASLVIFWPLTLHPTEVLVGPQREGLNDLNTYYVPSRHYAVEMQKKYGEFPAWNPHVSFGVGYVGNPQSALYYLPNWICNLIDASIALSWLLVVHHWWAGFGVYALLRAMNCRWGSAVFAGIAALAGPYWIAHTGEGHYAQICAVSWIPWGMLAYASIRRGGRFSVVAMMIVLAMSFFCNHVQETYYLVLILSVFVAADTLTLLSRKDLRGAMALLGRWFAVGVLTAGIVCIDLIPIQVYSYSSMRAVFRESKMQINDDLFLKRNFAQLLDPFLMGTPEVYDVNFTPYCEMALYFGVSMCVLAGTGIAACQRRPGVMRMSLLLLGTFMFALGRSGPLFPLLYDVVPGIAWFRGPSRVLFFTQLLIAMLAGVGVDWMLVRLKRTVTDDRKRMIGLPLLVALSYGVLASVLIVGMRSSTVELNSAEILQRVWMRPILWFWLFAPALVMLIGGKILGRISPQCQTAGVLGTLSLLVLLESAMFSREALTTMRPLSLNDTLAVAQVDSGADEPFPFEDIAATRRDDGTYPRVVTQQFIISDERAAEAGIHKLRGYDPLMLTYYFVAMLHLSPDEADPIEKMGFWSIDLEKTRLNLINLYGVKYAVWPQGRELDMPDGWTKRWSGNLPPLVATTDADVAKRDIPVEVWENPQALPRAFVVGKAEQPKAYDDLNRQLDTFEPRKTVLLEHDVLPEGSRSKFRPAIVTSYTPTRISVHAELDAPGYLVLTDLFHPGWSATDNGKSVDILRGNLAFRVIPLDAGKHDVEFAFRPVGYQQGRIITLITLFIVLIIVINRLRKPVRTPDVRETVSNEPVVSPRGDTEHELLASL